MGIGMLRSSFRIGVDFGRHAGTLLVQTDT